MLPKTCPVCNKKTLQYTDDLLFCDSCKAYQKPLNLFQKPLAWTAGKWWWWRVPIVIWFVVLLLQNLHDNSFALDRLGNPFSALDLGMHELGHIIFSPFGEFMYIAGGSLFQCIFPLLGVLGCLQKRWYFGFALCWCWLGLNFFDVATYAADARSRLIPLSTGLAGLGEQGSNEAYDRAHDWYQLLSRTHHLESDQAIAHVLRIAGTTAMIFGISLGLFLIINMIVNTAQKRHQRTREPA